MYVSQIYFLVFWYFLVHSSNPYNNLYSSHDAQTKENQALIVLFSSTEKSEVISDCARKHLALWKYSFKQMFVTFQNRNVDCKCWSYILVRGDRDRSTRWTPLGDRNQNQQQIKPHMTRADRGSLRARWGTLVDVGFTWLAVYFRLNLSKGRDEWYLSLG